MWHDPTTDTVIYHVNDPRVLQYCAGAKPLHNGYVAMPADLDNLQLMRCLGYPVIRPLRAYSWPRSGFIKTPFEAQTETANFLACHPRACCFSDMGTGKTLASLWAADAVMDWHAAKGETIRCLIVAKLSALQTVWADAIFQHFMRKRKVEILHGTPEQRLAALARPADFYLINHDGIKVGAALVSDGSGKRRKLKLSGFAAALATRTAIRMAIIDEVGAFRAYDTLRSKVARHLLSSRDYLWLLTGTPTPNGPEDAYGIAVLLNGARGETFTHYRGRVMYQVSPHKWVPRAGANEEAHKLMSPSIRFKIEDCVDLPELTIQTREAELSDQQAELMKTIKRELLLELEKGTVTVANEAALRTKMMQIACGVVYDAEHVAHRIDCRPRLAVVREVIEEAGSKVLIWAPFTSVVNMLNESLKEFSRRVILGATPVRERTEIIRAFQQERDPHLLIAHPETIGESQNLTAAATNIWYGPTDKTNIYLQANKRSHRPGQKLPCTVVNLASTKVEHETYRRLANNESLQGLLLKMVEEQRL